MSCPSEWGFPGAGPGRVSYQARGREGVSYQPGGEEGSAIRPGTLRGQAAPPPFSDWGLRLGPSAGAFFCSSFHSSPPQPQRRPRAWRLGQGAPGMEGRPSPQQPPEGRLRPCGAGQGGERPRLWPLTQPRQRWPEAPFPRGALLQRENPFRWGGRLSSRSSPRSAFLKAQTQARHRVPTGDPSTSRGARAPSQMRLCGQIHSAT